MANMYGLTNLYGPLVLIFIIKSTLTVGRYPVDQSERGSNTTPAS